MIFEAALANPAVRALLGENPTRFFPFGNAPEDTTKPYALYQLISGVPENYLDGSPDLDGLTYQVDVYGRTIAEVEQIARALRAALEAIGHVIRLGANQRGTETSLYRKTFDLAVFEPPS